MKQGNLIMVDDVRISTTTVSIQVIRIGAKQMTLAVFRQLPHRNIFDKWGKLLAPPWGWVNYEKSWHSTPFIFSHEGVLYRDNVEPLPEKKLIVVADYKISYEHSRYEEGKYIPMKQIQTPNGKWVILMEGQERYDSDDVRVSAVFGLVFPSEEGAHNYIANRIESADILLAAPQLFIAV